MKDHFISIKKVFIKRILSVIVLTCLLILPSIMFGQNPGDNPDAQPQAVPLDSSSTLLLIAAGAFLSVRVLKKRMTEFSNKVLVKK